MTNIFLWVFPISSDVRPLWYVVIRFVYNVTNRLI